MKKIKSMIKINAIIIMVSAIIWLLGISSETSGKDIYLIVFNFLVCLAYSYELWTK